MEQKLVISHGKWSEAFKKLDNATEIKATKVCCGCNPAKALANISNIGE